jgi:L-2-hydroxyglutarate oxidase
MRCRIVSSVQIGLTPPLRLIGAANIMPLPKSVVIIGAGIVGLAIANKLSESGVKVTVIEKEAAVASHQSSRNSGVIHAGPYYRPGSLKAKLCNSGNKQMIEFAINHGIAHKVTGKLIVATSQADETRLKSIAERAKQNMVDSELIGRSRILELEPHCGSHLALHVKKTAIINFGQVARKLADLSLARGAELILRSRVTAIREDSQGVWVEHEKGCTKAEFLINAAGLHSDKIALVAGLKPALKILPFKGEYFEVREKSSQLVNGLIYPTPDMERPFLGVHLTKMISGAVHAGPNALLGLRKEGYRLGSIDVFGVLGILSYGGYYRFLARNRDFAFEELQRSYFRKKYAEGLAKLVPALSKRDLAVTESGIRAQAVAPDGSFIEDFLFERTAKQLHILNAPSPAASASIAIADFLVMELSFRHLL